MTYQIKLKTELKARNNQVNKEEQFNWQKNEGKKEIWTSLIQTESEKSERSTKEEN